MPCLAAQSRARTCCCWAGDTLSTHTQAQVGQRAMLRYTEFTSNECLPELQGAPDKPNLWREGVCMRESARAREREYLCVYAHSRLFLSLSLSLSLSIYLSHTHTHTYTHTHNTHTQHTHTHTHRHGALGGDGSGGAGRFAAKNVRGRKGHVFCELRSWLCASVTGLGFRG